MNPYLRAAQAIPAIKAQAIAKLEHRRVDVDGTVWVRARDEHGRFVPDDPATPEDEAWIQTQPGRASTAEEVTSSPRARLIAG